MAGLEPDLARETMTELLRLARGLEGPPGGPGPWLCLEKAEHRLPWAKATEGKLKPYVGSEFPLSRFRRTAGTAACLRGGKLLLCAREAFKLMEERQAACIGCFRRIADSGSHS